MGDRPTCGFLEIDLIEKDEILNVNLFSEEDFRWNDYYGTLITNKEDKVSIVPQVSKNKQEYMLKHYNDCFGENMNKIKITSLYFGNATSHEPFKKNFNIIHNKKEFAFLPFYRSDWHSGFITPYNKFESRYNLIKKHYVFNSIPNSIIVNGLLKFAKRLF